MRPPETFPHGTTLHPVTGGYRIRRPDRFSYGRVFVRCRKDYPYWYAVCDAWDGCSWNRDRVFGRQTIEELEAAVRDYTIGLDQRAYVASGDCHA